ncbi:MAG: UDP-3-O-[3-hydroxymyristoyl] N-acetylglucosamine deacetylase [Candidatus Firestonebacteria bacterium RIFOXYC2_FULL_39_67]|nr:MAG: UDP-3-O-[3-hydroxymyristoyl] N-acetylglucosamine deacetylase [Candidatus Firestonebacteria bacterium RIFOXYD2_FULL_39_29]OGF52794.1 MAG: UDP-3-O-[3-hydroxymyristoyl] N-acetylglucosamine deacetylase [Candidatus Firestonebacteria bacterium RifOxyC12_full_39_7]OGF54869.1 MAG: UDP-3-O-[3-hydroxymyristoyl] N-acetylglucosamine deacetylase [Candidatus Firestonebacteria bacterium RIFOXYC2_FULL_39_67]
MSFQTTIKKECIFTGIGLHNGVKTVLRLMPAEAGTGILFSTKNGEVKGLYKNAVEGSYALTLVSGKARVITCEHLLAALYGAGVDNVICELTGSEEVPIMDGSASEFSKAIKKAGLKIFSKARKKIIIKKDLLTAEIKAGRFLKAEKAKKLEIRYYASFDNPAIGSKYREFNLKPGKFIKEISNARTFGWTEQVKIQKKLGLIKGAGALNALMFNDKGVVNKGGLRYKDEIVRHKILDLLGALALLPFSIKGRFIAFKSGHSIDIKMIKKIGGIYDR